MGNTYGRNLFKERNYVKKLTRVIQMVSRKSRAFQEGRRIFEALKEEVSTAQDLERLKKEKIMMNLCIALRIFPYIARNMPRADFYEKMCCQKMKLIKRIKHDRIAHVVAKRQQL